MIKITGDEAEKFLDIIKNDNNLKKNYERLIEEGLPPEDRINFIKQTLKERD